MPFGHDANDLPVVKTMKAFNTSLLVLVHPMSQSRPEFEHVSGSMVTVQNVSVESGNAEIKWDLQEAAKGGQTIESEEAYAVIQRDMAEGHAPLVQGRKRKHNLATAVSTRSSFACIVSEVGGDSAAVEAIASLNSMIRVASTASILSVKSQVQRIASNIMQPISRLEEDEHRFDTPQSQGSHDNRRCSSASSALGTLLCSKSMNGIKSPEMELPGADARRQPAISPEAVPSGENNTGQPASSLGMASDMMSPTTSEGRHNSWSASSLRSESKPASITSSSDSSTSRNYFHANDTLSTPERYQENAANQYVGHSIEQHVRC